LNLTDTEIRDIRQEQVEEGGEGEEESSEGGFGGSGGGGGGLFGGSTTDTEETPEGDEGGEIPDFGDLGDIVGGEGGEEEETPEEELNASLDHDDEDLIVASTDHKTKIKPVSPTLKKSNHRRYVRHQKSGRADVGMSDMTKLVDYDKNPFAGNPFAESIVLDTKPIVQTKTMLARSPDMIAMFAKMEQKNFGINKRINKSILKEQITDVQDQIDNTNIDLQFEQLVIVDDKDEG
jgi:hypothetical protein